MPRIYEFRITNSSLWQLRVVWDIFPCYYNSQIWLFIFTLYWFPENNIGLVRSILIKYSKSDRLSLSEKKCCVYNGFSFSCPRENVNPSFPSTPAINIWYLLSYLISDRHLPTERKGCVFPEKFSRHIFYSLILITVLSYNNLEFLTILVKFNLIQYNATSVETQWRSNSVASVCEMSLLTTTLWGKNITTTTRPSPWIFIFLH